MSAEPVAVGWSSRVGAWLAIGTSPAALVLGAGLASRHGGPTPVVGLLLGAGLMVLLLYGQGLLGLAPPIGHGGTLSDVSPRYLAGPSSRGLNVLLAAAMVGWFGFNVSLGGAALAVVLGLPGPVGPVLLGVPVAVLAAGGIRRWNPLAVVTTVCVVGLVVLIGARLAPPIAPISVRATGEPLVDAGALVGYVSVFGLRAPDFSHGLRSRRDLGVCVASLVATTLLLAVTGAALGIGARDADVIRALSSGSDPVLGNLLLAIAVIAPTFTTIHSGGLALRGVAAGLPPAATTAAVAVPGLVLAVLRFDRHLVPWLTVLAAVLPAIVVPMAWEAASRRRGNAPRPIPAWTWAPGSLSGLGLAAVGHPTAGLAGLVVAGVATVAWEASTRLPARR